MPYTNAPVNDTYSVHRIPMMYGIESRSAIGNATPSGYDAGMINVVAYKHKDGVDDQEEIRGETRLAISAFSVGGASGNVCRGMYVWEKTVGTNYYFCVVGTSVYTATNPAGTWTAVTTLATSATTPVRFTEYIDATNVKKLIMVDGVEGFVFTSNAAGTKIVSANFPNPHIPFPIFLDGYLFLAKAATGDIYNSDLNAPETWTAGNFISTEVYPDDVLALVKINNYIMAVGQNGCEYFYDAANPTGTPLARQEGSTLPFGSVFVNSIATNKDTAVILANNNDGQAILRIIEGFKYKDINATAIMALINTFISNSSQNWQGLRGYFFRKRGELYYTICFNGVTTSSTNSSLAPTLVYSFADNCWSESTYNTNKIFPVYFSSGSNSVKSFTYIAGSNNGQAFFGWFIADKNDSLDNSTNVAIYQEIRTPQLTFGTLNRKFMYRLGISYMSDVGSLPITVQWTDTGGNTIGTYTSATLEGYSETAFPFLHQLGSFQIRQFKFSTTTASIVQWVFCEVAINKGQR